MNTVNIPGFTAERALCTSVRLMAGANGDDSSGVIPYSGFGGAVARVDGNSVTLASIRGKLCRMGCWAAGGLGAYGCTGGTIGLGGSLCVMGAGAVASWCSDRCPD